MALNGARSNTRTARDGIWRSIDDVNGSAAGVDLRIGDGSAKALRGFCGNEVLSGEGDNDGQVGGLGLDTLTGGAGNDHFIF